MASDDDVPREDPKALQQYWTFGGSGTMPPDDMPPRDDKALAGYRQIDREGLTHASIRGVDPVSFTEEMCPEDQIEAVYTADQLQGLTDRLGRWMEESYHASLDPNQQQPMLQQIPTGDADGANMTEDVLLSTQNSDMATSTTGLEPAVPCQCSNPQVHASTQHTPGIYIPDALYNDSRITKTLRQFERSLCGGAATAASASVPAFVSCPPTRRFQADDILLAPCVVASRVGSDIMAVFEKIEQVRTPRILLLLFHHQAQHNWRIRVPTKRRLSDQSILQRCEDIIDLVFWNGDLYDCPTNTNAAEETKRFMAMVQNDN